ncbi:MAG: hypothetical protein KIT84_01985 [Labilithrix sp.]|nr:hypothetical protein [Labilithrix sp.]MCW5809758.1 hypothetical protein [Labilithrix sp.]
MQRRVALGTCVVVWLGAALFIACSDDDDRGAAASTSDAGADGEGSQDAGPPGTEMSACLEYMNATCERRAECEKQSAAALEECLESTRNRCPEYFFAPGTTRTIDGMLACAAELRAQSCDDVRGGVLLACQTFGTLEAGAACIEGSQCASGTCNRSPDSDAGTASACGTCAGVYAEGQVCTLPAPPGSPDDGLVCPRGQRCDVATKRCVPMKPRPELECSSSRPCAAGSVCKHMPDERDPSRYTCVPRAPIGERCGPGGVCDERAFCNERNDGGTCEAAAAIGEDCYVGFLPCVEAAHCTGTCVARLARGEPCAYTEQCAEGLWCIGGACSCVGGGCSPPAQVPGLGESCSEGWCAGDARCRSVDATSDRKTCVHVANRGEACTAPNTRCADSTGLECSDAGTCVNTRYEACLAQVADAGAR